MIAARRDLTPVSIPQQIDGEAALLATWTYNANGQMSNTKYPDSNLTGPTYSYGYDTMLRINGMTQGATTLVNDVLYGPAGEMTQWRRNGTLETRSFNIRGQLINIHQNGALIHEYRYAALSDGRAIAHKNWVSGEDVNYTYDSLGRLKTAVTAGPEWGQSFGYDGFGNLLSKSVVKGSAPALSITVDPATNRINGQAYDANGNMTGFGGYDMKNRLATASGWTYGYDTANRRMWKKAANGDLYFDYWAPSGEKLGGYKLVYNVFPDAPKTIRFEMVTELKYFAGRKLELTDQLGSQVAVHPYGEERTVTANDTYKFATYFRDANGLDYAVNRYYSSVYGRFLTPDPFQQTPGGSHNPGSWNKYAYVEGDPVNANDPKGLLTCRVNNGRVECYDSITVSAKIDPLPIVGLSGVGRGQSPSTPLLEDTPDDPNPRAWYCQSLPDGRVVGLNAAVGVLGGLGTSAQLVLDYHTGQASLVVSAAFGASGAVAGVGASTGFIIGVGNSVGTYVTGGTTVGSYTLPASGITVSVSVPSGGLTGNPLDIQALAATAVQVGFTVGLQSLIGGVSVMTETTIVNVPLGSFIGTALGLGVFGLPDVGFHLLQKDCAR